ncbi:hypothetical protein SSU05_1050 [Streptococcus suis 05ZYH33]|nr:hypothetical protein SSU05_1050 [Streptococcus suis 05ZYH33]
MAKGSLITLDLLADYDTDFEKHRSYLGSFIL